MKYRYLLFDLDGTLIDSGEGITKSAQYALGKLGVEEPDLEKLKAFVGPPLVDSFERYYGMDEEHARLGVVYYRERYAKTGICECHPYDGIPELLAELQREGRTLIVASSKPEAFVIRILERFQMEPFFSEIVGATMDGSLLSKPDIIREVFDRCGLSGEERNRAVMIGDRRFDIDGAESMKMDSIGVYYGFAEPDELERAGATYIVRSVAELSELLHRI